MRRKGGGGAEIERVGSINGKHDEDGGGGSEDLAKVKFPSL